MFKKIMKWGFIGFCCLIALAVIGGIAGGGADQKAPTSSATRTVGVGEEFKLGEFTYKVAQLGTAAKLGNEFTSEKASRGAKFVVVKYTERNDGRRTHHGLGSPFDFQDAQGRTFQTSSRGETALMLAGGDVEMVSELHPGIEREAYAVFEVPEDALQGFRLVAKERGAFGTGQVFVVNR